MISLYPPLRISASLSTPSSLFALVGAGLFLGAADEPLTPATLVRRVLPHTSEVVQPGLKGELSATQHSEYID